MTTRSELLGHYLYRASHLRLKDVPKVGLRSPYYVWRLAFNPDSAPVPQRAKRTPNVLPQSRTSHLELCTAFFSRAQSFADVLTDRSLLALGQPVEFSDALRRIGRVDLSIRVLETLLATGNDPSAALRLARALLDYGDVAGARRVLENIDDADLLPAGLVSKLVTLSEIVCAESEAEAAVAVVDGTGSILADHADLARQRLSLLARTTWPREHVSREFSKYLARFGRDLRVIKQLCDYLVNANETAVSLSLIETGLNDLPQDPGLFFRALQIGWQIQDESIIRHVLTRLIDRKVFNEGLVGFVADRVSGSEMMKAYIDAFREWMVTHDRRPAITAANVMFHIGLSKTSLAAGEPLCKERIDRIVSSYPFLPEAQMMRAAFLAQEGRHAEAEDAFASLLKRAPQMGSLYPMYHSLLKMRPDSAPIAAEMIELQLRHVFRYPPCAPTTSRRPSCIEAFQHFGREGNLAEAIRFRGGRRANLLVASWFPDSYRTYEGDLFGQGQTYDKIGIIGWDGVADEVRWAQNYGFLSNHSSKVVVSCDPRLQGIFTRSFPGLDFVPIARRFPLVWTREPIIRSEIEDHTFSGVIDGNFRDRLRECDLVMFSDEISFQVAEYGGAPADAHDRGRGYLVADQRLSVAWRKRFLGKLWQKAPGKRVIGLLWSSMVRSAKRDAHYLSLNDLLPLAESGHHFVVLQSSLTDEERAICHARGFDIPDEVDLMNDLESVAAVVSALDLVIGISTLPFELAGAVGTEVWMLAVSPEGLFFRRGVDPSNDQDRITRNGRVFGPDGDRFAKPRSKIVAEVVRNVAVALETAGDPQAKVWDAVEAF
jgi:hypothetical protein